MLVNQFTVTGNLGRDPDMSYTPNGTAVTKFSIAVYQGEKQPTLWLNVTCWDKLAERVNEQAKKGNEIFIQGRLSMREYDDKNGVKRQAFELVANSAQLTQKKDRVAPASPSPFKDDLGELDDHPF
jgi:single-strand DNA-binding protein